MHHSPSQTKVLSHWWKVSALCCSVRLWNTTHRYSLMSRHPSHSIQSPTSLTTGCQTLKTWKRWTVWHITSLFPVVVRGVHDLEHCMSFQHRLATICIFEIWVYVLSLMKAWAIFFWGCCGPLSSLVVGRGAHTLSTCFSFQKRLALACFFDIWISVVTLTFFEDLHTFFPSFLPCSKQTSFL